jgi:pantetheine-phosphate adenylyltransferase
MSHALYPGSFDVLTYGHLDVIRRAADTFPRLTVGVAENPSKRMSRLFDAEERVAMLQEALEPWPHAQAAKFTGLTVHFARALGATVLVRGLRVITDFEFELNMAMTNGQLDPGIVTVFLAPPPKYLFVSSSLVKEVAAFGGDISAFVPPHVEKALQQKLHPQDTPSHP